MYNVLQADIPVSVSRKVFVIVLRDDASPWECCRSCGETGKWRTLNSDRGQKAGVGLKKVSKAASHFCKSTEKAETAGA